MKRLGQFLIELGWISDDQLARALQSQEVLGGRLGTCLLELGAVDEEQLVKALSHQLGVEGTRSRDLQKVPPEVYGLLPAKAARRCQAVPFRMLGGEIHVALLDVLNLGLHDEIAFATGKTVRPFVAHEARIYQALADYYDLDAPARYRQLLTRLDENGSRPRAPSSDDAARLAAGVPEVEVTAPVLLSTLSEPAAVLDGDRGNGGPTLDLPPLPAAASASAGAPPATPAYETQDGDDEAADLDLDCLDGATEPDEVAQRVVERLHRQFPTVALFKVRRDEVNGWMGAGDSLDTDRLRETRVGLDQPSLFLNFRNGGLFFAGALPPMAAHREVASCWGGELPRQCLVLPVRVRDRLVSGIVCIPGDDGLAHVDMEEMNRLARQMGAALGNCIVHNKRLRT